MRLSKKHIGRPFQIIFWDHSENVGHTLRIEAYGKLMRYDRKELVIRAWDMPDDPNTESPMEWAILRKAILPDGMRELQVCGG